MEDFALDLTLDNQCQNYIARPEMGNPVGSTKLGQTMKDVDIRHYSWKGNMVQYNLLSA